MIEFNIYLQSTSKAMPDREKKRGRWKYKNLKEQKKKNTKKELFR